LVAGRKRRTDTGIHAATEQDDSASSGLGPVGRGVRGHELIPKARQWPPWYFMTDDGVSD